MNILCNKVDLIEAVSNVQRAVSTKASLPALEGILIRVLAIADVRHGVGVSVSGDVGEKHWITCGNFPVKIVLALLRGAADLHGAVINAAAEAAGVSGRFSPVGADRQGGPVGRQVQNAQKVGSLDGQDRHGGVVPHFMDSALGFRHQGPKGIDISFCLLRR